MHTPRVECSNTPLLDSINLKTQIFLKISHLSQQNYSTILIKNIKPFIIENDYIIILDL